MKSRSKKSIFGIEDLSLIFGIALLMVLTGCSGGAAKTSDPPVARDVRIGSFFPEGIHAVDRIEMLTAGGERKAFVDKAVIDGWIGRIGKIVVTIDPEPEEGAGILYQVALYAEGERMLSLTPRSVNDTVIFVSDELTARMDQLWEEGDTRQPSTWGELPSAVGNAPREQSPATEADSSGENGAGQPEINAELSMERTFFNLNKTYDTAIYLKNGGPAALYFGGDDAIEQWEPKDGLWYRLPLSMSFSSRAYSIEPGEAFSQDVRVPALLPAGQYRIVKSVQAMDAETSEMSDPVYLAVEFVIGRND